jgi:hypothetical protein
LEGTGYNTVTSGAAEEMELQSVSIIISIYHSSSLSR